MIEDEEQVPSDQHRESLLYDYLKHLASLSLITLGGILTISQMDATNDISAGNLATAIVLVGAGGGLAFACSTELAAGRYAGKPLSRTFNWSRRIAPGFFVVGIGYALAMFVDVMV